MHEQVRNICQGLDILSDLVEFFSVDGNLQREDNRELPHE